MCGLVGVAGNLNVKDETVFKQLLYVDFLRGKDSTGVAQVTNTMQVNTFKKALPVSDFMHHPSYTRMFRDMNRVLIGHNRAATKGVVIDQNAHPFHHGSIVGVHNGTLQTTHQLPDYTYFNVDSDNLIYSLDYQGTKKTYEAMNGAAAVVYWDQEKETLNFFRNDDRPLHYAYSEDRKSIYWASELGMLDFILSRENIKTHKGEIYKVVTDHLYSIKIPKIIPTDGLGAFRMSKLEPYTYKVAPYKRPNTGVGNTNTYVQQIGNYKTKDNVFFDVVTVSSNHIIGKTKCGIPVRVPLPAKSHKHLRKKWVNFNLYLKGNIACLDLTIVTNKTLVVSKDTLEIIKFVEKKPKPSTSGDSKDSGSSEGTQNKTLSLSVPPNTTVAYDGDRIPLHRWEKETEEGCLTCGSVAVLSRADVIVWQSVGNFYCDTVCQQDGQDIIEGEFNEED